MAGGKLLTIGNHYGSTHCSKNVGFKINVEPGNPVESILPGSFAQKAGIQAGNHINVNAEPTSNFNRRHPMGIASSTKNC